MRSAAETAAFAEKRRGPGDLEPQQESVRVEVEDDVASARRLHGGAITLVAGHVDHLGDPPQGQTHLKMIRRAPARLAISSAQVWCSCATHAG
jgi:hypothetical protein